MMKKLKGGKWHGPVCGGDPSSFPGGCHQSILSDTCNATSNTSNTCNTANGTSTPTSNTRIGWRSHCGTHIAFLMKG